MRASAEAQIGWITEKLPCLKSSWSRRAADRWPKSDQHSQSVDIKCHELKIQSNRLMHFQPLSLLLLFLSEIIFAQTWARGDVSSNTNWQKAHFCLSLLKVCLYAWALFLALKMGAAHHPCCWCNYSENAFTFRGHVCSFRHNRRGQQRGTAQGWTKWEQN